MDTSHAYIFMLEVNANPPMLWIVHFSSQGPDGELDISVSLSPLPFRQIGAGWVFAMSTATRPLKVVVASAVAMAASKVFLWAGLCDNAM